MDRYGSFTEAVVSLVPTMKLEEGEQIEFEAAILYIQDYYARNRITLVKGKSGELVAVVEALNSATGEWMYHTTDTLSAVNMAISMVVKARKEGFWLVNQAAEESTISVEMEQLENVISVAKQWITDEQKLHRVTLLEDETFNNVELSSMKSRVSKALVADVLLAIYESTVDQDSLLSVPPVLETIGATEEPSNPKVDYVGHNEFVTEDQQNLLKDIVKKCHEARWDLTFELEGSIVNWLIQLLSSKDDHLVHDAAYILRRVEDPYLHEVYDAAIKASKDPGSPTANNALSRLQMRLEERLVEKK